MGSPLKNATERHSSLFQNRGERLAHKLDVLREHCQREGRPFNENESTVHGPIQISPEAMSPADLIEILQELEELGIGQFIFNMPNAHEIEPIERIGEEVITQI